MKSSRVKVLSVGDTETGKSCLIKRYCEKRFISKYLPTIGVDFGVTKINISNRELKVNLFDLSGHCAFKEVYVYDNIMFDFLFCCLILHSILCCYRNIDSKD